MRLVKRLIADLVYLLVLVPLLLSSCIVPGRAYIHSPRWFLEQVGPDVPLLFYVALAAEDGEDSQPIKVAPFNAKDIQPSKYQYHLPDGHATYNWSDGGSPADIDVTTEADGSQLVRVFVVADSPNFFSSLSEYRVVHNKLVPLRYSGSIGWFLLGIPIGLILSILVSDPMLRGIRRLMGVGRIDVAKSK